MSHFPSPHGCTWGIPFPKARNKKLDKQGPNRELRPWRGPMHMTDDSQGLRKTSRAGVRPIEFDVFGTLQLSRSPSAYRHLLRADRRDARRRLMTSRKSLGAHAERLRSKA